MPKRHDSFFGRTPILEELVRHIGNGQRLISLISPPGLGKTRLAQELGHRQLDEFPGGVWFCDLSRCDDQAGIINRVAMSLNLKLTTADPTDTLIKHLERLGRTLVILDNMEQLSQFARGLLTFGSKRLRRHFSL